MTVVALLLGVGPLEKLHLTWEPSITTLKHSWKVESHIHESHERVASMFAVLVSAEGLPA